MQPRTLQIIASQIIKHYDVMLYLDNSDNLYKIDIVDLDDNLPCYSADYDNLNSATKAYNKLLVTYASK